MTEPSTRLHARPRPPDDVAEPGLYKLELGIERDGALYIPDADGPRPLLVVFHGATMHSGLMARPLLSVADDFGVVLLIPDSRGPTWDIIAERTYGPDIEFTDRALDLAFGQCKVDPERVGIAGVSDGASYALSVGVGNGDLFSKIVAWSPGFMVPMEVIGKPAVFVSHGVYDRILRRRLPRVRRRPRDARTHRPSVIRLARQLSAFATSPQRAMLEGSMPIEAWAR